MPLRAAQVAMRMGRNPEAADLYERAGAGNPDDVSVSLPRIVGARGVVATLCPIMSPEELEAFGRSVKSLQEASREIRY